MTVREALDGSGRFDVVVIGASAGGLAPMRAIIHGLDASFGAAVAVVLHRVPHAASALSEILRRDGLLAVEDAVPGTRLRPGLVVVAATDRNLVLHPAGETELRAGERHYVKSALDPVLESAAAAYGDRVVAVILSGGGHDGTEGAQAVHEAGGVVLVQEPSTAATPAMPRSVQAAGAADLALPSDQLAGVLTRLVAEGREGVLTRT